MDNACKKWIKEVKTTARACPCILVGTKLDLRDEVERSGDMTKLSECVSYSEVEDAAKKYAFQGFVLCSAKEKKGLNKLFHTAFKVVFQMKAITERMRKEEEEEKGKKGIDEKNQQSGEEQSEELEELT